MPNSKLTKHDRTHHWLNSKYAEQYLNSERRHIKAALRQAISPSVLQIGTLLESAVVDEFDLPFVVRTDHSLKASIDLVADPAFLPIAPDSVTTVILPHALESHNLPHQVLREAHRVLMSEGHLVLTGFNPWSLMGLQSLVYKKAVIDGRFYTPGRVIDWLQLLGFEVVASAMFQYAPLSRSERIRKACGFFESVGDRWLPMMGGGYMITAKKRETGMTLIGRTKFRKPKRAIATAAPAKASLKNEMN